MKRKLSYTLRGLAGYQEVGPEVTSVHINDAEHLLGLTLVVRERDYFDSPETRYYAKFDGVEVLQGSIRIGDYGDGKTPRAAIKNYISRVSGERCVIGGYSKPRYFTMPKLHI